MDLNNEDSHQIKFQKNSNKIPLNSPNKKNFESTKQIDQTINFKKKKNSQQKKLQIRKKKWKCFWKNLIKAKSEKPIMISRYYFTRGMIISDKKTEKKEGNENKKLDEN
ncbi:hypothetical protein M0811_05217 [Anaeramoeba ignava]|uniref:Uncharacterized protein n=1 Tax=Anaeramoeba ignava TaxID=1746090 RepID=A0A9Q0LVB9_ANAIG|nr:hypothetical protein M0811_05217 [Anaeramoeba ignava]